MTAKASGPPAGADRTGERTGERITVALIPAAAEDLQQLVNRTGLSKTDIVNRALTLYEYVDSQLKAGNDLLVRDRKTGETQIIRFL